MRAKEGARRESFVYPLRASAAAGRDLVGSGTSASTEEEEEEWETKKKVETTTKRELERRSHRQVVLDNGRLISEDTPEVTVDVVEDTQTHEDDGGDESFARFNGVSE